MQHLAVNHQELTVREKTKMLSAWSFSTVRYCCWCSNVNSYDGYVVAIEEDLIKFRNAPALGGILTAKQAKENWTEDIRLEFQKQVLKKRSDKKYVRSQQRTTHEHHFEVNELPD